MIVGVILKYFKTYQGINYIPLTDDDSFCGLVGENGVGKSSILEALDCFFNNKQWNLNSAAKRSGLSTTKPQITPIFLLKRDFFKEKNPEIKDIAEKLNEIATTITESTANPSVKLHIKEFISSKEKLFRKYDKESYYLLPLGLEYQDKTSISIFNTNTTTDYFGENLEKLKPLLDLIKETIDYLYIPKEIDPELFTKLESDAIQVLMGETLTQKLLEVVPKASIDGINQNLTAFIDEISYDLEPYVYRTPTNRQQNLKRTDVYNLIIENFFKIRKLHKKQGEQTLEISQLSSGEKQKAIIDITYSFLKNHRATGSNLILAIDEPESSLHVSACFDQFESLYSINQNCMQVIFSSHWYGFLPTVETGSATIITLNSSKREHHFDQINLSSHREEIKQLASKSHGKLPYDIRLKSINDFIQSVITNTLSSNPYHWIICEGTSEKIYLSKYLKSISETTKIRIIPVGGAKEIKRIYKHLEISYDDFKNDVKTKILLISDTDAEFVKYETNTSFKNLICKRIVNCGSEKKTKLVHIMSNPTAPATEIETSLNGLVFLKTIKEFRSNYEELSFLDSVETTEEACSYYSLDLRTSDWEKIHKFLDKDNNKYNFAQKYTELLEDKNVVPEWIQEIIDIIST